MPEVNMRQLCDTRKLKAWLSQGKTVVLRERNHILARIVPESKNLGAPVEWPDFDAESRTILGDRILPGADIVIEERGRY